MRTDIAGFAGFTERGPVTVPSGTDPATLAVKLTSWKEYRARFGGFFANGYLPYAVRAFFENGGTTCYVARVADPAASHCAFLTAPGPPMSTPLTALAADAPKGQTNLSVASSAGLAVGDTISVSGAGAAEFFAVAAVVDAKTITVARATATFHAGGDSVERIPGRYLLAKDAAAGQTDVVLNDVSGLAAGDLVTVNGPGVADASPIQQVLAQSTIRLSRKLQASHTAGDVLLKYAASFTVRAASPGNWGNRVRLGIVPLQSGAQVALFSLRVTLEPGFDPSDLDPEEFYPQLSLDPKDPKYAPTVVNAVSNLVRIDAPAAAVPLVPGSGPLADTPVYLVGGRDGLSTVTAQLFIGSEDAPSGLNILERVDEIAILSLPDAQFDAPAVPEKKAVAADPCSAPPLPPPPDPVADDPTASAPYMAAQAVSIYQAAISQCERLRYRVVVVDPPTSLTPLRVQNWLSQNSQALGSRFAALYYPWLKVPQQLNTGSVNRAVPPSGFVAGVYANTDLTYGVQRPPANALVEFAVDVDQEITDGQQANLNPAGINAIRAFPGRGILVWGARSLENTDAWRFIHVRRLMSAIEESVEKSTQWTVFEPNDANLRNTLVHSLNVFLTGFWTNGGLKGTSPAQAFYVKCDGTNNPQSSIDAGMLICEVGVAVAAPMEFLVFEIRRVADGSEVAEA